jgi:hypothetical protein
MTSISITAAGLAALALLATAPAQATGRAEVNYVAPETFTDAGFGALERERTQRLLTQRLDSLAQRLPDGQVLRVAITDVDLAGEVDTLSFHRVRVMGQLPDAPRLSLRFELLDGGTVLAQGDEQLSDLSYLVRHAGLRRNVPLPYESRMLEAWFGERFAPQIAAAGSVR